MARSYQELLVWQKAKASLFGFTERPNRSLDLKLMD
jgi:hypothetical protein